MFSFLFLYVHVSKNPVHLQTQVLIHELVADISVGLYFFPLNRHKLYDMKRDVNLFLLPVKLVFCLRAV